MDCAGNWFPRRTGERRLEHCQLRGRQVGRDDAYLSGQPLRVPYDCCNVVACGDGLLEDLPTDTAGRREDRELHLLLPTLFLLGDAERRVHPCELTVSWGGTSGRGVQPLLERRAGEGGVRAGQQGTRLIELAVRVGRVTDALDSHSLTTPGSEQFS